MVTQTYRCLNCLDATVDRGFNVSHLKVTCKECDEFARFVHDGVYQQYQEFEDDSPDGLDWETLSKMEKFVVAEKMVREGKSVEAFDIERNDDAVAEGDA